MPPRATPSLPNLRVLPGPTHSLHLIYPLFLVFRSPLKSPKISKQTINGGDNHHPTTIAMCLQHLLLQHLGQLCPTDQVFGHSTSKVMLLEASSREREPPQGLYFADVVVENKTWWWQVSLYHEGRVLYSPSIIFLVGNPTHWRVLTRNDPPAKHFMARYLQLRDIVALFEQRLSWENNHLNKGCAGCWGQPWLSLFKPATHIRPRLSLCHSNDDIVCNIQHLKISTWHLEVSTSNQYSAREHLTAWTCCGLFWEH